MTDESPTNNDGVGVDEEPSFAIDAYERRWMQVSVLLLVGFLTVVSVAGFMMGIQVSGAEQEVDPRTFTETEPWASPGLREVSPGHYKAYVIARTWAFEPAKIEVPVGSTVDIYVTSPDLQHGFKITDTNVNMQIVPGQVSKLTYTFDTVGTFPYICHEYCGKGHAGMFGMVEVVDELAEDSNQSKDDS